MTFLVDTGAQHSVLTKTKGPMSTRAAWLQGATGGKLCRWTTERKVHLASGKVTHSFLHVPDCPYPLLGVSFRKLRELLMDREAWLAVIHVVANSWTRLSD